jgi:trans-aconitate methyltransferase
LQENEDKIRPFPGSDVYYQFFTHSPWGLTANRVIEKVIQEAPRNGRVLDLCCGPGYILSQVRKERPDLRLTGIDSNVEFLEHAKEQQSGIEYKASDVFEWKAENPYDVVTCTGGLHHIPYAKQEQFLKHIHTMLSQDGLAIIADPYLDDSTTKSERRIASVTLGHAYLEDAIRKGCSDELMVACMDIMHNDMFVLEYKNSIKKIEPVFRSIFREVELEKMWPDKESEFGDYIVVCKK